MSEWTKGTKTVTVERRSQYGIFAAGDWINISKNATFRSDVFEVGKTYELAGAYAPEKAGKRQFFIDSYRPGGPGAAAAPSPASQPAMSAAPAVQPKVDYAKKDTERDARITVLAILKSVVESPALPLLVTDSVSFKTVVEHEARHLLDVLDRIVDERVTR